MIATTARTATGRPVPVLSTGSGPGVVVVHGAAVSSAQCRRLARVLGARTTVHLYDRYPQPEPYHLENDIDTLEAVLRHTGSGQVLGHSYGGLVALRAGLRLRLDRIAVYDPGISINGCFPAEVVEPFAAAVEAGDLPRAAMIMSRRLRLGPVSALPAGVQLCIGRLLSRTALGRHWLGQLPSVVPEFRTIVALDAPARGYAALTAEVLLAVGDRSPWFFAPTVRALAEAVPGSRFLELPRARHDSLAAARPRHVEPFARFFTA